MCLAVLHEAIVELWRRRSGEVWRLTGIGESLRLRLRCCTSLRGRRARLGLVSRGRGSVGRLGEGPWVERGLVF